MNMYRLTKKKDVLIVIVLSPLSIFISEDLGKPNTLSTSNTKQNDVDKKNVSFKTVGTVAGLVTNAKTRKPNSNICSLQ